MPKTLKIKISTNQIGTAIDYWQDNDWRCLELFSGRIDRQAIRKAFLERAASLGAKIVEVQP